MKKTPFLFTLIFSILFFGNACDHIDPVCAFGTGSEISSNINLPAFNGIELNLPANVFLKKGDTQEVEIQAQSNIIEHIDHTVHDSIWRIHFDHCITRHSDITIFITLPSIYYIELNSSGNIFIPELFEEEELNIVSNGSGDINLNIEVENINTKIKGSGNVEFLGSAAYNKITITGSGDVVAFDLLTSFIKFKLNSSGNAFLLVEDRLSGQINGSGNIYYRGTPSIDVVKSGSGDLINAN